MTLTLRRATVDDIDTVLGLLDDAVRWLVAQGRTGQWGTEPFSTDPNRVATARRWLSDEADGQAAGAMALGDP